MNQLSLYGSVIVTLALISYSIGVISEQRSHLIKKQVLIFVSLGIVLDIAATTLMILGSTNSPFTFHGFIGYSALAAMLIDASLLWSSYSKKGINSEVKKPLHLYSRYAYLWWVVAYITGGLLVALK